MTNEEKLSFLTVKEKAALLEGCDSWYTNTVKRGEIKSICMTDGPHGVRKVKKAGGGFEISENERASAFPTEATLACSFDPSLVREIGEAIADECIAADVDILLAPAVNIKRSPLCGRNFEYYSEDPLLSGILGAEMVKGLQSRGVGACIKHFALNSNEKYRFGGDSIADKRAFREIYLKAFEIIIRNSSPEAVMASYNRIDGVYATESKRLLSDILRKEWGYKGLVMTDWGATADRPRAISVGCDLDMPGQVWENRRRTIEASENGTLGKKELDQSVLRVLDSVTYHRGLDRKQQTTEKERTALACRAACESAVLLKNDGILPLDRKKKYLCVGEFFERLRFQGAGSSLITPYSVTTVKDAFLHRGIDFIYHKGYTTGMEKGESTLVSDAETAAHKADAILFFGGLTDFEESEGFDRPDMKLSKSQTELLYRLISTGKPVVLILFAGAPVELPFIFGLNALLDMYLPGMEGGEAAARLLFGEASPCGRLAESWLIRADDSSCAADYNKNTTALYYESVYVGYRFYDKAKTPLQFPFGYGLNYTTFEYGKATVESDSDNISVKLTIKNTGNRDGAETVQLYSGIPSEKIFRPKKELRSFYKVFLHAGESKEITLLFGKRDLCFYHSKMHRWVLENGTYPLYVSRNSQDTIQTLFLTVTDGEVFDSPYSAAVMQAYLMPPVSIPAEFAELYGAPISALSSHRPFTLDTPLEFVRKSFWGKMLFFGISFYLGKDYRQARRMKAGQSRDAKLKNGYFMIRMLPSATFRSLSMASCGQLTYSAALALTELSNGKLLRGIRLLYKSEHPEPLPDAPTKSTPGV